MHGPTNNDHREMDGQLNILRDTFVNTRRDGTTDYRPVLWWDSGDAEENAMQAQLRIWKLLRELDVLPIFLPHLQRELVNLLRTGHLESELITTAKEAMRKIVDHERYGRIVTFKPASCEKCLEAENQAKRAMEDNKFRQGKAAKAIKRFANSLIDIWRK